MLFDKLVLGALVACTFCLIYPVMSVPVRTEVPAPTASNAPPTKTAVAIARQTDEQNAEDAISGRLASVSRHLQPQRKSAQPAPQLEPLHVHGYKCRTLPDGHPESCNVCYFSPADITPSSPCEESGDCNQRRVEGTNVTRVELAENGVRYLQVGGDWWNKAPKSGPHRCPTAPLI